MSAPNRLAIREPRGERTARWDSLWNSTPPTPRSGRWYEGPTKSLIDVHLGPLLGFRIAPGRMVSADQQVRELRVTRGHRPVGRGVLVSVWSIPEQIEAGGRR